MDINGYEGVVQECENSCGAYALASALTALELNPGNTPLFRMNPSEVLSGYHVKLERPEERNKHSIARRLYEVSGVLDLQTDSATYRYVDPVEDRNAPSALVSLAKGANAKAWIRVYKSAKAMYESLFVTNVPGDSLYNTEKVILIGSGVTPTLENSWSKPGVNEVQLVLVNVGQHWLTLTDCQLYDPGDGSVGDYHWESGAFKTGKESYPFTGMWITLAAAG